jgi:hypothetical protein
MTKKSKYNNHQSLEQFRNNLKKMNRIIAEELKQEIVNDKQAYSQNEDEIYV